jgi:hypothetical protein
MDIQKINEECLKHVAHIPVKNIIEIGFSEEGDESRKMRDEFMKTLKEGVSMTLKDQQGTFKLDDLTPTHTDSNRFLTRQNYENVIKYFAIKSVVDKINEKYGVRMSFLLTEPHYYVPIVM